MTHEVLDTDSNEEISLPQVVEEPEQEIPAEPVKFFFMAAVRVIYIREEKVKEKSVNILLELSDPNIVKATLNDLNQAAANRVVNEGQLPPDSVREIIVMGIWPLASCTRTHFHTSVPVLDTTTNQAES